MALKSKSLVTDLACACASLWKVEMALSGFKVVSEAIQQNMVMSYLGKTPKEKRMSAYREDPGAACLSRCVEQSCGRSHGRVPQTEDSKPFECCHSEGAGAGGQFSYVELDFKDTNVKDH